ncbi:MAG: formate dehydrogenase accessory sulfurtransferase FdhD [Nitrospirota bacterium]
MEDYVAVEKRLKIFLNGVNIINLSCTPFMIEELINGLFLTEEIVKDKILPENMNITYGDEIIVDVISRNADISETSALGCLGGVTFTKRKSFERVIDHFSTSGDDIRMLFAKFQEKSDLFRLTGCFHSAALSDGQKILVYADDIGRHNTIDKLVGYCVLKDIPLVNKMILLSCRISSDIVSKCAKWKIPLIASRAAPTDLAIDIATRTGITLIGFLRGDRFNIYTNRHRVS